MYRSIKGKSRKSNVPEQVRRTYEYYVFVLYIMIMKLTTHQIRKFQNAIWDYYHLYGRHNLPWRKTRNPYRILVSEVMLQQTQVERVIPKYNLFIRKFPSLLSLACARLSGVIAVWQGLGYNRRAVYLKRTATHIAGNYKGRIPRSPDILQTLPGIGNTTASAIAAFAFGQPTIFIETNIRTVYIHFFLTRKRKIHDKEIAVLLEQTLDYRNIREWYYALMDYGVHLKKQQNNLNKRSVHYTKQSRFEGSSRQVRGKIIRLLSENGKMTKRKIEQAIQLQNHDLGGILTQLQKDGLIHKKGRTFLID